MTQVGIIDFGSQYALNLERVIREMCYSSEIVKPEDILKWLRKNNPRCLIFSGGPASVYEQDAPSVPAEVFDCGKPILGICYGMQLIAKQFGGRVENRGGNRNYGEIRVHFLKRHQLFKGMPGTNTVFASYGDSVVQAPTQFRVTAFTKEKGIAAISNLKKSIFGVQFHPEVIHTPRGSKILQNFLQDISWCAQDISVSNTLASLEEYYRPRVKGKTGLIAYSGGVDSSVLAEFLLRLFDPGKLQGICIDTGGLRENELDEIERNALVIGLPLQIVDAKDIFLQALMGSVDPEEKRAHFKNPYRQIINAEAKKVNFLIHGTIRPDRIESAKAGKANIIKTHHNPDMGNLHPFQDLYKQEVREVGRLLGLPEYIIQRQPFPGPGLYIRIVGAPVTEERLAAVRWADKEVRCILSRHGLYEHISQLVVGLLYAPIVGVKGDKRAAGTVGVVKTVESTDFMTAKIFHLPHKVEEEIASVVTKLDGVVDCYFPKAQKPPATIELQ